MPKIVTDPQILALFDSAPAAATTPSASPKASFVSSLLPFAQASAAKSGLPVELVLAQAALESGWGKSAKGNNYFGIKAHGYGGKTQSVGTHEYENGKRVNITDTFRAYDSPEQSFDDHADFLRSNRRYQPVFEARDGIEAARALQKAGYATDPKYADKLISIMESPEIKSVAGRQGQAPAAATGAAAKRQGTPVTDPKILALFDDTPNPDRHPAIAYLESLKKPEGPKGKGFFGDMGAAIWQGFVNVLEGDAYTVGRVTGSETVMAGADALKAHSERVHAGMDEDMRAGAEKKWVTEDNKALGDAWGDADAWKYVIGSGLGSIAGTILGGGIIKAGARFAIKRALTAGISREAAKREISKEAAERLVAQKLKKLDPYIGMGSYGAVEGAAVAGSTGRRVFETTMTMPAETLNTSPYFQEVFWENRDAFEHLSNQEVHDLSRKQVAMGAEAVAMAKAGAVAVLLGSVAGKYLDDALNARTGGGMASRVGTQMGVQGGTESAQAGYEQYAGNEAIQDYANPAQDPWAGTGNAAVGEAIGGTAVGGLLGIPGAKPAADAANPAANAAANASGAANAADPAADPAIGEPLTDPIKRIGQAGTVEEALAAANDAMLPVEFDRSTPELTASPGAAPEDQGIDPGIPFAGSLEGVGLETPEEAQRRTRTDAQGRRVLGQGPLDAPQTPMGMPQGLLSGAGLYRPTAETSEELAASQREREEQARRTQDEEIAWNNQPPRNPALGDALEQARVERRETRTLQKTVVGEGQSAPGAPKGDLADSSFHYPGKLTRDITRQSGKPFSTEEGARNSAKIRKLTGYTPVEVKGGWILRRNQDLHLKPNDPPQGPSVPDSTPPKGPGTGFTPTHITPDGTEVRQIIDGEGNPIAGLYEDADGVEIEDDAAEPITHSESGETTVDGQNNAQDGWTQAPHARVETRRLPPIHVNESGDSYTVIYTLIRDQVNGKVRIKRDTQEDDGQLSATGEDLHISRRGDEVWGVSSPSDEPVQFLSEAEALAYLADEHGQSPPKTSKADEESATVKPPKSGQQLSGSQAESQAKQADSQTKVAGEDEAKPPKTDRPKGWQPIGENAEGETVFEDESGVRSVVSNGIRSTKTVQVGIKRGGVETSVNPDTRDERFKPASDQFSNYKSFIEAQSWLDFGGLTNQIWTDERLEDGEAEILIDLIERKTKDQPDKGPHFAAGRKAFQEDKPRTLPSYFTTPDSKNARDWYRGWDSAQDDKPDTKGKPDQAPQSPLTIEQAEALYEEGQAIMRKLPSNIGKAKQNGKLSANQLKSLERLKEIDKILPNTSPQYMDIYNRRRAEIAAENSKIVAKFREEQQQRLAEKGFQVGDTVTMFAPGWIPGAGTSYQGTVKMGKRGNVYVHTPGGNFDLFNNPWEKVKADKPSAPQGGQDAKGKPDQAKDPRQKFRSDLARKGVATHDGTTYKVVESDAGGFVIESTANGIRSTLGSPRVSWSMGYAYRRAEEEAFGGEESQDTGGPTPNKNGVYADEDAETLQHQGKKAQASIRVLKIDEGWISAARFEHLQGSYTSSSEPLSAAGQVFATREQAIHAAAKKIIRQQESIVGDQGSVTTDKQRAEAQKIIDWAKQQLPQDDTDTNSKPDQSTQKERYLQSIQLNPEQDSLLIAIAKLGGLDRNEAQAQGIDPASFKTRSGLIGKPIFRKTHGLSFDAMAEQLSQYGYVSEDYSANELLDKVDAELRGERQFTPNGTIANEERNLADQEEDPFLDGSTDDELDESGFTDLDAESQDYAAAVASARVKLGDEAVDAIMERLAVAHPNVSTDHYYELAQDALKEAIDEANTEQAPAGGRGSRRPAGEDTPQEDFSLTGQTEAERRAEEQRLAAAEQKRRREADEAEQKRKADAERDSFTLTGSDLPADANPNQADLLGAARPPQQTDPFAGNKIFTSDKVAAARERLKKKLSQLNSGIDPEILQDGITIAGAYIESGVRDFAAYAKAMVGDFGDAIKPFLRSFYEGARYYPGLDTEGMTTAAEIDKLDLDKVLDDAKEESKPRDLAKTRSAVGAKILKSQQWIKKRIENIWGPDHGDLASYDAHSDRVNRTVNLVSKVVNQWTSELGMEPISVRVWSSNDTNMPASYDSQNRILRFKPSLTFADGQGRVEEGAVKDFETLAHEFGHALFKDHYEQASDATKQGLKQAFEQWAAQSRALEGTNLARYATKKPLVWGAHTQAADTTGRATTRISDDYLYSFEEWVADQTAQHLANRVAQKQDPLIEQFFRSMAAKLRRLYRLLTGEAIGLNAVTPEFTAFVEGVRQSVIGDTIPNDQEQTDDTRSQSTEADGGAGTEGSSPKSIRKTQGSRGSGGVRGKPGRADSGELRDSDFGTDVQDPPGERQSAGDPAEADDAQSGGRRGRTGRRSGVSKRGVANYNAPAGALEREGSWKTAAERNLDIIELVKRLESEGRQATPEEQALIAQYVGFGPGEIRNNLFPTVKRQVREGRTFKEVDTAEINTYRIKPDWKALSERAQNLLSEEELTTALQSTQYAHYTSETMIRSIWKGVERMGFTGGKVLEPGMGTGLFAVGAPAEVMADSRYTGIEMDHLTAAIARQLLPQENVIRADYASQKLPRDFFDLAIGNPPFSQTRVLDDPDYRKQRFMLHDYFFAKSIDRVRPGGLLVFVTSKGTLDKQDNKARQYLAERADLVGAIRLPQTAFKHNAGTEVVTDVLFLQRREEGAEPGGESWLGLSEVQTPEGPTLVNEYFAAHPEMVLGTHSLQGSMRRENEYTVLPLEGDMDDLFAKAVQNLPENIYRKAKPKSAKAAQLQSIERDFNPANRKEGGLYLKDGNLMRVESGSGVALESLENKLSAKDKEWLTDYVPLRDAVKQAQYDQLHDGNWEASLKALNTLYDRFLKKHGPINAFSEYERTSQDDEGNEQVTTYRRWKNNKLLRMDIEESLVRSLEKITESGKIIKSPFLGGRTIKKPTQPKIETLQDALFVTLNDTGHLDLDHLAGLVDQSKHEVIDQLGNLIYETPQGEWQLHDEYLSGDVVTKLEEAQAAAEADPRFERNVDALLAVQPKPLEAKDITVSLGSNWLDASVVSEFAAEVLEESVPITYNKDANLWLVEGSKSRRLRTDTSEWGTPDRSVFELLDAALNNRTVDVRRTERVDGSTRNYLDPEATAAANEKLAKMRRAFSSWIWTDAKRAGELTTRYNRLFNNLAPRQFDGSHLTLPGLSLRYKLFDHQKRAIWRIIQTGNTYLAHAVGAGKTLEMIVSGMEQRRLGLIRRPMYVVPNHMLRQFSSEFLDAYPMANIMVADEANFHTDNRRRFIAQASLNDPDAIIITHSGFGLINVAPETRAAVAQETIDQLQAALQEAADEGDRVSRSRLEQQIEQIRRRVEGKANAGKKDNNVSFEEMGVDFLYIDEAHEFRKLDFATNRGKVKGIDPGGSAKALDLYTKLRWLNQHNDRSVVLASGTAVTNTMAELYTVMRYMAPDELEATGLNHFDAWANQFGEVVGSFEQNAAGNYEFIDRFAKFVNVPELMKRIRMFMDVLTSSQLGELVQRPALIGETPENMVTQASPAVKAYLSEVLAPRIETAKAWKPSPQEPHNLDPVINIITDGRLASIDLRFNDPAAKNDPSSKLNLMLDKIIETHREIKDIAYTDPATGKADPIKGGTQIVFSAVGFGEQVSINRGFDLRGFIMKRLKEGGIPASEVAWMSDYKAHAKKESLFKEMRSGQKKILIGSPQNMGTGLNVQKRLKALHYLSPPWYPSDVEQPHGRILRQGNQNKEVWIGWYATKGTYDSTMWGMVARKSRFIEQAMSGDDSVRKIEDISESSQYEMAAALAAGDERAIQLAGLRGDIERLTRLKQAHFQEQRRFKGELESNGFYLRSNQKKLEDLQQAREALGKDYLYGDEFYLEIGGQQLTKRGEIGQAVLDALRDVLTAWAPKKDGASLTSDAGKIAGKHPLKLELESFKVFTEKGDTIGKRADINLVIGPRTLLVEDGATIHNLDVIDAQGLGTRIGNAVNSLPKLINETKDRIAAIKAENQKLKKRIGAPFESEQELNEKIAQAAQLEQEMTGEGIDVPSDDALSSFSEAGLPLAMRPAGGRESPLFRRVSHSRHSVSHETPRGLSVDALNRVKDAFQKKYPGTLPVKVIVKATQAEAFGPASRKLGRLKGGYDEKAGHIILIAENIDSIKDAQATLVHELVTHFGLRELLGEKALNEALADLIQAEGKNQAITRLYDEVRKDYPDVDALTLAEEVLARASETHVDLPLIRRIMARLMELLRRAGLYWGGMTLADVDGLISESMRNLKHRDFLDSQPTVESFDDLKANLAEQVKAGRLDQRTATLIRDFAKTMPEDLYRGYKVVVTNRLSRHERESMGISALKSMILHGQVAEYDDGTRAIYVRQAGDPVKTFIHENGHLIFDYVLTETDKQAARRIYDSLKGPSRHAVHNANYGFNKDLRFEEWFAESFADYHAARLGDRPQFLSIHGFEELLRRLWKRVRDLFSDEKAHMDAFFDGLKMRVNQTHRDANGRFAANPIRHQKAPRDENFKRWFGNSNVVDEKGEPLVVYHLGKTKPGGEPLDILYPGGEKGSEKSPLAGTIWESRRGVPGLRSGPGIWFGPKNALSIGTTDFNRPGGTRPDGTPFSMAVSELAATYPVYLSLQNPLVITNHKQRAALKETVKPYPERRKGVDFRPDFPYRFDGKQREQLIAEGYDSIILDIPGEGKEYIAFRSEQIKSATGNSGAFDPNDPDIRFSRKAGGNTITLYTGSPESIDSIKDRGMFGGLFASTDRDAAASHGAVLHEITIDESEVLTQRDLDYNVDYDEVKQIIQDAMPRLSEDQFDAAYGFIVEDKSVHDSDMDESEILDMFRADDLGEASWEAQRIRGIVAKKLGYKAVEMEDEHGTSYLVLPGATIAPFKKGTDGIKFRRQASGNATLDSALSKIGRPQQGLLARIMEVLKSYRSKPWAEIKRDLFERTRPLFDEITQGMMDRYHGIKRAEEAVHGGLLPAEQSGYVGARLSTGLSSVMRAFLLHGTGQFKNGIIQKKAKSEGLFDALSPVKAELDDFLHWMIGLRAEKLMKEERENLFTAEEIQALKGLSKGREQRFQEAFERYGKWKTDLLDLSEQAGLIDPKARLVWEHAEYVPFYRIMEEGGLTAPGQGGTGLTHQSSGILRLKGGTNNLGDPLSNILINAGRLINASLKNSAMDKVMTSLKDSDFIEAVDSKAYEQAVIPMSQIKSYMRKEIIKRQVEAGMDPEEAKGFAKLILSTLSPEALQGFRKMWAVVPPKDPDIVRVMRGGKAHYYRVKDAALLRSLTSMSEAPMQNWVMDLARGSKRLFTSAVTATPDFMLRNFLRDALHTWTISKDKHLPFHGAIKGAIKSYAESGGGEQMLFAGASFQAGYVNTHDPKALEHTINEALRDKGIKGAAAESFLGTVVYNSKNLWDKYRRYGNAAENANREVVFEETLKRTKSIAQAVYEAKDLMDFSMRGDWRAFQILTDTIPFLNARIVGMHKLGRSAHGASFFTRAALLTAATMLLWAWNKDDERYKKLEDWDRNSFWHFWMGDQHLRLPKPFEIGLVFGTLPEGAAEAMYQRGGQHFLDTLWFGMTQTLAVELPVIIKPVVEVSQNRSHFTGRDIENMSDEGKPDSMRYAHWTSDTLREIGNLPTGFGKLSDLTGLSPKELQHLWRGYLGEMGMYALTMTDWLVRDATGAPAKPETRGDEWPLLGAIMRTEPPRNTRHTTEFYRMLRESNEAYQGVRALVKERTDPKDVRAYREENREELRRRSGLTSTNQALANLRRLEETIARHPRMSPEVKRQRLEVIYQKRNALTQRAVERFN